MSIPELNSNTQSAIERLNAAIEELRQTAQRHDLERFSQLDAIVRTNAMALIGLMPLAGKETSACTSAIECAMKEIRDIAAQIEHNKVELRRKQAQSRKLRLVYSKCAKK